MYCAPTDPRSRRLRSLPAVLSDRRGATSLIFAAGAVVLFGFFALATEGGLWYLTKRKAQNAADAAAFAAASALESRGRNPALSAGAEMAGRNGFAADAQTEVTVSIPPASGPNVSTPGAAEVLIHRRQPTFLAGVFLGQPEVLIAARAVAAMVDVGPVCMLSLRGSFTMTGNSTVRAADCVLASNKRGPSSIDVGGSTSITARSLRASGECAGCSSTRNVIPPTTYSDYQTPVADPFAALNAISYPATCPAGAEAPPTNKKNDPPVTVGPLSGGTVYWCNSTWSNNGTVYLRPGTYILHNTSIALHGGTVSCPTCTPGGAGVTFVLTGSSADTVGTVDINAQADFQVNAPGSGPYAGVVMYRDDLGSNQVNKINGGAGLNLIGAMYFPSSTLWFNGNSDLTFPTVCRVIVADTVTFTGNADIALTQRDCARALVPVPQVRALRLLE